MQRSSPGDRLKETLKSRRPWPTWGRIREVRTDGSSDYHALQAQYSHRSNAGVSVTASYAFGHMIDSVGDETNVNSAMIQNPIARWVREGSEPSPRRPAPIA
jgi:hypothetical protein